MQQKHIALLCTAAIIFVMSCSRKSVPETTGKPVVTYKGKTVENTPSAANTAATNTATKRTMVKRTTAAAIPAVIMVNDKAAKKNIDGRLYYDLGGHRYWRNYDDGKYYLFNKNMYGNKAFIPH